MTKPDFQIVAPHSAAWPRNSEGDIAVFPDGRWLLAWSAFYGGWHDHSPAHIMGRWSHNKGKTWGDPIMLLENDGKCNVLSVSVTAFRDGTVGSAHSRTDHENCFEAWPFYRRSTDGGADLEPPSRDG
jgi:Neuraminidase (sialidase)